MAKNQETENDPFGQHGNDEVNYSLNEKLQNLDIHESFIDGFTYNNIESRCYSSILSVFQDTMISGSIGSLNPKQRSVFEIIHKWSRDSVRSLYTKILIKVKPFLIFPQTLLELVMLILSKLVPCRLAN